MRNKWFYLLLALSTAALLCSLLGVADTLVSIKYTAGAGCISTITGDNLCRILFYRKLAALACFVITAALIIFRKRWTAFNVR